MKNNDGMKGPRTSHGQLIFNGIVTRRGKESRRSLKRESKQPR